MEGLEVIIFLVGPAGTPFHVHKNRLSERFPSLDVNSIPNPQSHPRDDPSIFRFLVAYLHNPHSRIPPVGLWNLNAVGEVISPWEAIPLYSLAEKWELYELRDSVMSRLKQYHKEMDLLPTPDFVRDAYEQTDPNSGAKTPLKNYCVRAFRYMHRRRHHHKYREIWPTRKSVELFDEFPAFLELVESFNLRGDPRQDPR
jgi:hypothetical protein